jgi:hypothetical protein
MWLISAMAADTTACCSLLVAPMEVPLGLRAGTSPAVHRRPATPT